ncbi:hypothetical protein DSO57_1008507 [Entomophthora muscae]|uniref:Uncharacterized protein n=1 Tax=Entomophthora muscae TaxID=34485 RepID=A0ACC2THU0_9FUNG|nr:hypothetical protein DSO57_1008507 [Entomophthora muscae]
MLAAPINAGEMVNESKVPYRIGGLIRNLEVLVANVEIRCSGILKEVNQTAIDGSAIKLR